jgi:hypothetical protein
MQNRNTILDKILIPLGLVGTKRVTKKRKVKSHKKKTFRYKKSKPFYKKSGKKIKRHYRKKTYGKY